MQVQSPGWEDPLEEGKATTPIFLPGESHGQRSLEGYSPWGHKESGITELTEHEPRPWTPKGSKATRVSTNFLKSSLLARNSAKSFADLNTFNPLKTP